LLIEGLQRVSLRSPAWMVLDKVCKCSNKCPLIIII
jgi:hypothetical protein